MNIGRFIFYDVATGDILVATGESSGDVNEVAVEDIINTYQVLQELDRSSFGVIAVEYGYNQDKAPTAVNIDTLEITWVDIPINKLRKG